jgi:hypothetical protein
MGDNDHDPDQRSANYLNFGGGFTGFHNGFNNPGLNRPTYTHPPLFRVSSFILPHYSMSPRMVDVDEDMEEQTRPNSRHQESGACEVDMNDIESSVESSNCPMVDRSAFSDSRKRSTVGDSGNLYDSRRAGLGEPSMASGFPLNEPGPGARHETVAHRPLPSVHDLLNQPSPFHAAQDPAGGQSFHHRPDTPPSSPIPSQFSSISFNTICSISNILEQRRLLVTELYHACLDASRRYILTLLPSPRYRQYRMRQAQSCRHRPYPPSQARPRSPHHAQNTSSNNREPTLMDNISTISTRIWREARSNIMAPHRAEADTVRAMRNLYAWGEIVVRGMESGGEYENEDDGRSAVTGLQEDGAVRVAEAAKSLCGWLSDSEAWGVCERALRKLRELDGNMKERSSFDWSSDGIP